jgi:hypothetical protein
METNTPGLDDVFLIVLCTKQCAAWNPMGGNEIKNWKRKELCLHVKCLVSEGQSGARVEFIEHWDNEQCDIYDVFICVLCYDA